MNRLSDMKRELDAAAKRLRQAARDGTSSNVNIASRQNIVTASNTGEPDTAQHASTRQSVHITQRDGSSVVETHETSETSES